MGDHDVVIEKTVRMNMLFDLYGSLLTKRQQRFFELYYADDLSLGEIAEQFDVSRQAVYDIVKRSAEGLENFESRLSLLKKSQNKEKQALRIIELTDELKSYIVELSGISGDARATLQHPLEQIQRSARNIIDVER